MDPLWVNFIDFQAGTVPKNTEYINVTLEDDETTSTACMWHELEVTVAGGEPDFALAGSTDVSCCYNIMPSSQNIYIYLTKILVE